MKLVETDIPHGDEEVSEVTTPPRPEHRRVYVSLAVTLTVLAATVIMVYVAFPPRDNELLTQALEQHHEGGAFQLRQPTEEQLDAWTLGALGGEVALPPADRAQVVGARTIAILKRPAAVIRYEVDDDAVTLLAIRTWDAVPRTARREENESFAVSWRRGAYTYVAVGPKASSDRWRAVVGAP